MSNIRIKIFALIFAACLSFLLSSGCTTSGVKKPPGHIDDHISEFKNIYMHADLWAIKDSGVFLQKGDLFSIIVNGKINTAPHSNPNRWEGPYSRLVMLIGDNYFGFSPINRTLEAERNGNLKFYIRDGGFNLETGLPFYPEHFKDNQGVFYVTIIVWKNKDWTFVSDLFQQLESANPENEAVKKASAHAQRYRKVYLAEKKAAKEVEKTRKQLDNLKNSTGSEIHQFSESVKDPTGIGVYMTEDVATDKKSEVGELEAKLATLMVTMRQLEETKKQLAAERQKSARLSKVIESAAEKKDGLQNDQYPPQLLIASPNDGQRTNSSTVQFRGLAEDNHGLLSIELYVNENLISTGQKRGLKVEASDPIRRFEFNEKLSIKKGPNRIKVRVIDINGMVAERAFLVHREDRVHDVWAVIVGIDNYAHISGLKYAVKDAKAFYNLLSQKNRIPAEKITLLTNEQATLANLRSVLGTQLKRKASRDDMVIIYYAGHGATERDAMSPDGDGLEKYILPHDAKPKDLYASALPMREVSYILNRIQSERLVFIADACYSGASGGRTISVEGIRANLSDGFLNRISSGKGRVIITASGPNEVSVEDDKLQHGVFTYYLLKGLEGRADYDRDGMITVDEAYRFVSDAVPGATGQEQHPIKKGAVEGKLILGVVN